MKIAVISYSLTGNNKDLAKSVARELEAEHIKITEFKCWTTVIYFYEKTLNGYKCPGSI